MAIEINNTTVINNARNLVNLDTATFTGTGAIKLPAGTTAERPVVPVTGMVRFNTDLNDVEAYNTSEWAPIAVSAPLATIKKPSPVYVNLINRYIITNFDHLRPYIISVVSGNGTVTRRGEIIEYTPTSPGAGGIVVNDRTLNATVLVNPQGQIEFTSAGTYLWTVPSDVAKFSAVVIGGGAGGGTGERQAGNGGDLRYSTNLDLSLYAGQTLTIEVGVGGRRGGDAGQTADGKVGGDSFIATSGGVRLLSASGGNFNGTANAGISTEISAIVSGGSGGIGGPGRHAGGGGGAAGYSGNGGNGASRSLNSTPGTGGGGGGGGHGGGAGTNGAGGGGVGIYARGISGAAGSVGIGGGGGSGGFNGILLTGGIPGGGGSSQDSAGLGDGAAGAVRIIWGVTRNYPITTNIGTVEVGSGQVPNPAGRTVTRNTTDFVEVTGSSGTTHTVTNVPIGTVDANRTVIVCLFAEFNTATHITACTIGGVAATRRAGRTTADFLQNDFWSAVVPTGTSVNVVFTTALNPNTGGFRVQTFSLYGYGTLVFQSGTDSEASNTSTNLMDVAFPALAGTDNQYTIASYQARNIQENSLKAWQNVTNVFYQALADDSLTAVAGDLVIRTIGAASSPSVARVVAWNTTDTVRRRPSFAAIAFR